MKTLYPFKNLLLVFVIGLCGISCSENIGGQATSGKVITGEVTDVEFFSAVLHGKINVDISMYDKVQFGFMISESKESLKNHDGREYAVKTLIGQEYKLKIELKPDSTYYYCAWLLLNGVQYEFGDIKEFETLAVVTPSSGYVDLGLSVKWATMNEGADAPEGYGDFYDYDEAISKFGNNLPTSEQWEELHKECYLQKTTHKGVDGYKVIAPNGKSIFLPFAGYRDCDGDVGGVGTNGEYWMSPEGSNSAWYLTFDSRVAHVCDYTRCYGRSVRLVQN